jgi:uncharacterized protein (DUF885 family)
MRLAAMLILCASALHAASAGSWDALVDDFFANGYFNFQPTTGTQAGFHQYDRQLEDYSRGRMVDAQSAALKKYEAEFAKVNPATLDSFARGDREMLLGYIHATLHGLENVRFWEKNPDIYSSGITQSAFTIMSRQFAPPADRLRSLISREKQMPQVFAAARGNLKNPPKIYVEVALEQMPGNISFFEKDVPQAFSKVTDTKLLAEFRDSNGGVIKALKEYEAWMKSDLLPRAKGDFRLGADNYRKKLLYEEMVDTPLDKLLAIGYEDLRRNQQMFREVAARIDPKKTPQQILEDAEKDHPPAGKLLQAFRDVLGGLKDFVQQHHIVTIPSPVMPILEETPPFERALTTASMDTPGAYEKVATEAFFNVTLPEPNWTPAQVEEHLRMFNRGTITSTAIHEAFPGHYVQFLWIQQVQSKTRKLLFANSNVEGWAHYCEQMVLDEGYAKDDLKLRLGQLQDALLRDARYIVGIQMHTGNMTMQQGEEFFVKEGMQVRALGERETKRGTSDPTYLYYTLGKLEILKLRRDYGKPLLQFHDAFLKQGGAQIKLVRESMLGNQSPVL